MSPPAMADMSSQLVGACSPVNDPSSHSAREREVFRFLEPWRSTVRASKVFRSISLADAANPESSYTTVGCDDTALAAFAQLGALRLNADRCLVTLFSKDHEFVLAEATRTLSLQSDATHDTTDGLWIGTASYARSEGLSNLVLPFWSTAQARRPPVSTEGYYHIQSKTAHSLIVNDVRHNEEYASLFPRFNSKVRFLCSVPLRSLRGYVIGAYTIIGTTPRYGISEEEMVFLEDMAETVVNHLESKRAMLQKQNAERLIKGLGVFSQGGSSLREWWLETFDAETQRSRRQEQIAMVDNKDRDRQADEELGDTLKHCRNSERSIVRGQPTTKSHHTVDGARGRIKTGTEVQDFASNDLIEEGASPGPQRFSLRATSTTFDVRHATTQLFARASNLIREAMNADGVMFLDASFTKGKAGRSGKARRLSADGAVLVRESESTTSSGSSGSDFLTDSSNHGDATGKPSHSGRAEKRRRRGPQGDSTSQGCEPLGYSTRTGSSLRNFSSPHKYASLPQRRMERLIKTWPAGKIFNYSEDGTMDSSSGQEGSGAQDGTDNHSQKIGKGAKDADALCRLCDDARSIAFIPVWDPHRERWRASALVWVTTPGRHFTREEDLTYLSSFSHNISGELLRLDMLASDQAKATFISMMSHELRSPLHGVLAGADFLLDTDLDQLQHEMATTVKLAGSALLDTINAILSFTKINTTASNRHNTDKNSILARHDSDGSAEGDECTDLALLTENVVNTVVAGQRYRANARAMERQSSGNVPQLRDFQGAPRESVQVILSITHRSNWLVNVHSGSWVRILTNLVGNALKYTKEGYVHVKLQSDGNIVTLAVQDSGSGISLDYQKHQLYTAFTQEDTMATGTGLGLYIVKQLVSQMQGSISVESDSSRGQGTKILVTVPVIYRAKGSSNDSDDSEFRPQVFSSLPDIGLALCVPPKGDKAAPTATTRNEMLKSTIIQTSRYWLGASVRVIERMEDAVNGDVCFIQQSDFERWSAARPNDAGIPPCRIIVLTERFGSSYDRPFDAALPPHSTMDPPFGPRKFARVLSDVAHPKLPETPTSRPRTLHKHANGFTPQLSRRSSTDSISIDGTPHRGHPAANSKKLLLVEDNDLNMKLLVAWSRKLGVDYVQAENGLEAVKAYQIDPTTFHLILMDISMPIMDGFTATREIRSFEKKHRLRQCRIVAITGVASEDARLDADKAGIDDFLVKPASMGKLKQLIKEMDEDDIQSRERRAQAQT
ncbi:hypothetical protein KVT40_006216 [Elsinoe batatas]|uniref:Uncharacterized protein n=1 Tax=Elsinoe batatas TaxID=2601811 RepID=A0A8K0PBI5_9PEZI|nr:hypothetical protein KVT40_006216 [Elsinoe batatas]